MRDEFVGYYEPDFKKLWKSATFVLDANVLLDLYRLSPDANEDLLKVLEMLCDRDRLWMPHQFVFEYHENLLKIHREVEVLYSKHERELHETLNNVRTQLAARLNNFRNQHGYDSERQLKQMDKLLVAVERDFEDFSEKHKERLRKDRLEDRIVSIFDDRYGSAYSKSERERKVKLWNEKHDSSFSLKDERKDLSDPDGDLVGWLQILDFAVANSKPIIMTTNDNDWFYKKGSVSRPRPDLRKEMHDHAKVDLYIYKTLPFIERAKDYFQVDISSATIEEIRSLRAYNRQIGFRQDYLKAGAMRAIDLSVTDRAILECQVGTPLSPDVAVPNSVIRKLRHDISTRYEYVTPLSRQREEELRNKLRVSPWRCTLYTLDFHLESAYEFILVRDSDTGLVHILADVIGEFQELVQKT